jgi:AraC family transcriptional regulator
MPEFRGREDVMREYIEFVESEHVGPDGLSELVLTSTQTQWSGFPLEMRRVAASGVLACYSVPLPTLVLCTAGRTQARIQSGREEQYVVLAPDRLCLASAGSEIERVSWSGAHEILVVELCPSRLQPLIGDDDRLATLNISQQFAIEDRQLSALLTTMRAEVRAGCPAGRLYGQSLSLALATYLLNRYPVSIAKRETRKLKLSAAQFQRLRDYVEAHLSQDLTLAELTDVVDFSANHLTVLLKNTVGLTPHQYVIRERIRAGMRLLALGRVPIVEIALRLGFSSQSHFTMVFRRATGLTPRQYQQEVGWSITHSCASREDPFAAVS